MDDLPKEQILLVEGTDDLHVFKEGKLTRAYVHAWLAACKRPRPMGTAVEVNDLRHDSTNAVSLVGWLNRLFGT